MREFERVTNPNIPHEFPVVLHALDRKELQSYEGWCYKFLGKKAAVGDHRDAKWYQSGGYFFFRRLVDATQFLLGAQIEPKQRAEAHHAVSRGVGLRIDELKEALNRQFPSA
ncbi:hypothetical protein D3C87_796130 [compost metagenome]